MGRKNKKKCQKSFTPVADKPYVDEQEPSTSGLKSRTISIQCAIPRSKLNEFVASISRQDCKINFVSKDHPSYQNIVNNSGQDSTSGNNFIAVPAVLKSKFN